VTTIRFGDPTFATPQTSAAAQRANEVERALLECEVGQWLPVYLDKLAHAAMLATTLKKRGYDVRRSKTTLWVLAPETARPHVHRWVYPPGVEDATTVDGKCACGEVKPASANGDTP